ncbi:MAG: hypothetical protein ACLU99_02430 [Alphaproteobacteria bacterium]
MTKISWKPGTMLAPVPPVMVTCGTMEKPERADDCLDGNRQFRAADDLHFWYARAVIRITS